MKTLETLLKEARENGSDPVIIRALEEEIREDLRLRRTSEEEVLRTFSETLDEVFRRNPGNCGRTLCCGERYVSLPGGGRWVEDSSPPAGGDTVANGTCLTSQTVLRASIPSEPGIVFEAGFELPESPAYRALTDERVVGRGEDFGVKYALRRRAYVSNGSEPFEMGFADGREESGRYEPSSEYEDRDRWFYYAGFRFARSERGNPVYVSDMGYWAGSAGLCDGDVEKAADLLGVPKDGESLLGETPGEPWGNRNAFRRTYNERFRWHIACRTYERGLRQGEAGGFEMAKAVLKKIGFSEGEAELTAEKLAQSVTLEDE